MRLHYLAGDRAAAQIKAFEDTWTWDADSARAYEEVVEVGGKISEAMQGCRKMLGSSNMMAYLAMMAPRLIELRRALKPTGSLYIHCDPTASHYLKLVLDAIFGPENFRNEIVWHYGGRGAKSIAQQFPRNHDTILFYSKYAGKQRYRRQNTIRLFTPEEARSRGIRRDQNGDWYKTAPRGDYTDESIKKLDQEGRIYRTKTGSIRVKYFLQERGSHVAEAVQVDDTWTTIPDAMHLGARNISERSPQP